jgi:arylsulfatase A-like enzyme
MSTGFPTLAEQLAAAGYETMGFSCSVMFVCKRTGLNRGFKDLWTPDEHAQIAGETAGQQSRSPQRAAAMNQELTKWLSENRGSGKPFFLFVNYFDAHQPYVSPKKSKRFASDETRDAWESEDMAHVLLDHTLTGKDIIRNDEIAGLVDLYDDAVRYVDAKVGEVLAYLKKTGLDQNTAVLIASDHGDHFGDHHMMSHQFSLYEPLVRVPLIARWPDGSASGVEERLVQCHDVYPTILELAGLNWNRLPGQTCESLRSPLADGRLGISEYLVPYLSALGRVPRVYPAVDCSRFARRLRAVQRDKMKLIVPSDGSLELYDLAADPMELDNLVGEKPSLVRELSAELDTWRRSFSHYVPKPMPDGARKYRFTKNELETMRGNGYLQSASPQND